MTKKRAKRKPVDKGKGGGGGTMTGIRQKMKKVTGSGGRQGKAGKPTPASRAINIALWLVVLALLIYLLLNRLA